MSDLTHVRDVTTARFGTQKVPHNLIFFFGFLGVEIMPKIFVRSKAFPVRDQGSPGLFLEMLGDLQDYSRYCLMIMVVLSNHIEYYSARQLFYHWSHIYAPKFHMLSSVCYIH